MTKDSEFRSVASACLRQTACVALAVLLAVLAEVGFALYEGTSFYGLLQSRTLLMSLPFVLTFACLSAAFHSTELDIARGRTRRSLATAGLGTFASIFLFALLEAATRGLALGTELRTHALAWSFVTCGFVFLSLEVHWRRKARASRPTALAGAT